MSYDIYILDQKGKQLYSDKPLDLRGGTYAVGGTKELWLNVTYNYGKHFDFRQLDKKSCKEVISVIEERMAKLQDDVDDDYWKATEGNVKLALNDLLKLCNLSPKEGVINIS